MQICNPLPSLTCTNQSLCELLVVEQRYTSQISDVIRNDPSLSARILQLVNSAYFGLSSPVRGIAEAVFYLGLEQVRQLALITPVIEDFKNLVGAIPFTWRDLWQHSIGTAILTREVVQAAGRQVDEKDYLSGLLHDVGKIVMASVFPGHFLDIQRCVSGVVQDLQEVEVFVLGIDHAELGALYLQCHNVPEVFVETARYHHRPQGAVNNPEVVAAVQVADFLMRESGIGASGNPQEVTMEERRGCSGWKTLFGHLNEAQCDDLEQHLQRHVLRLPPVLEAMV